MMEALPLVWCNNTKKNPLCQAIFLQTVTFYGCGLCQPWSLEETWVVDLFTLSVKLIWRIKIIAG